MPLGGVIRPSDAGLRRRPASRPTLTAIYACSRALVWIIGTLDATREPRFSQRDRFAFCFAIFLQDNDSNCEFLWILSIFLIFWILGYIRVFFVQFFPLWVTIIRIFGLSWISSSNYIRLVVGPSQRDSTIVIFRGRFKLILQNGGKGSNIAAKIFENVAFDVCDLIMAHRRAIFYGPFGIKGRFHWWVPISSKCIAICAPPPRYRPFNPSFKLWKFEHIYIFLREVIMKFSRINSWFDFTTV